MSIEKEIEEKGIHTITDHEGLEWYVVSNNGLITVQKIIDTKNGRIKYLNYLSKDKFTKDTTSNYSDGNGY